MSVHSEDAPRLAVGGFRHLVSKFADECLSDCRTVRDWLSRIDKDNKEIRNIEIANRWFACYTLQEIAEHVGMTKKGVDQVCEQIADFHFVHKLGEHDDLDGDERREAIQADRRAEAEHDIEFDPPIYSVWKQQTKSEGASHFGNSEIRWVDNLLYLYTDPFDVVIDPFAGGGSTAELCRKRRQCAH